MQIKHPEQFQRYQRKSLKHVSEFQKLEELFGLAIETYIFINAANLLVKDLLNWTTPDGNGGQPLNPELYVQNEEVYFSAMVKMLNARIGRVYKLLFIELVIALALKIDNHFAPMAMEMIEKYQLDKLAKPAKPAKPAK